MELEVDELHASTTSTPDTAPMTAAPRASTVAQVAVMATRPARDALRHMDTSGFPLRAQVKIMHITVATAGAMVVLPRICAIWVTSAAAAPLKPYQPNHRMNTPRAPRVREWPGMAFTRTFPSCSLVYFPMRAPSMAAPIKAVMPPTVWMTVDPAKSTKPSWASQPWLFQIQPASMG